MKEGEEVASGQWRVTGWSAMLTSGRSTALTSILVHTRRRAEIFRGVRFFLAWRCGPCILRLRTGSSLILPAEQRISRGDGLRTRVV
jgi:hypothetical protein